MSTPSLTLSTNGISADLAETLCIATGAAYKKSPQKKGAQHICLSFPKTPEGTAPSILIESRSMLEGAEETDICLDIQTNSLDIFPMLQCLMVLLRARCPMSRMLQNNILSCMHEAVLNALIHGNLNQQSVYDDTPSLFHHFEQVRQKLERRKKPELLAVKITTSDEAITISITDGGNGFSEDAIVLAGESALYGRGLSIIRECCDNIDISDGGRTISMRFFTDTSHRHVAPAILQSHVLVVDDVAVSRAVIKEILKRKGFTNITLAIDGEDAIEKTLQLKPDLVLLDIMLPRVDGYEYCRRIREVPEFKDMPIVVQTILDQEEQRSKAFACGASDLVTKPINAYELVARISLHLERQALLRNLQSYQQKVQADLKTARHMQQSILPNEKMLDQLKKKYGANVQSMFQTSSEIGGDIWGIRTISEHRYAIYAVDFSGHGISAALNAFRLQALLQGMGNVDMANPGAVLNALNLSLLKLLSVEQFATMLYAVYDAKKQMLSYAAAGAPHPMLIRENRKVEWLDGTGLPLGISLKAAYPTRAVAFRPKDALLIYSDALIETPDTQGKFFLPKALEILAQEIKRTHFFPALVEQFSMHSNGAIHDDLTIVMLSHNKIRNNRLK